MTDTNFFPRYFAILDGPDPLSARELVGDEFEFAVVFAADASADGRQFRGSSAEFVDS